ncbi:MAG: hypothetical protein WCS20_06055, partial [Alphaproteobacteria bacterium]
AAAVAMAVGEVKALNLPDFVGLIRLDGNTPADLTKPDSIALRDRTASQVQQSLAQDTYDLFTSAMTAQGGLKIDQTVINSVQAQMN